MKKYFNKILIAIGVCLMLVVGVAISIDRATSVYADNNPISPYNIIYSNNWTSHASSYTISGQYIWTDGTNIYYSAGSDQLVLDVLTSTWITKTWIGLTSFNGDNVWTDGTNIYYSTITNQFVLDVSTSTWTTKTWTGLTSFNGQYIWTDGVNIYFSSVSSNYILDISTSTWSVKSWAGLNPRGNYVFSLNDGIYYAYNSEQYKLDISTSTWSVYSFNGSFSNVETGTRVWTDGTNFYYSDTSNNNYVYNSSTQSWDTKTWIGLSNFAGLYVFDKLPGVLIAYSYNSSTWYTLDVDSNSGGGSGGGNETNTLYHFTGSSYNLLSFANSTNYIVGNHYIDIEDISTTQFDITFNVDILTAVNGNNALSYSLGSSMSLSNIYSLNTSYTNTDYLHSQTFPYHINVTTTNWTNSDIVGCTISTILGVVSTQTNDGTWINDYGLVQYSFSYFNSSNERLNIMVAGTYDRTIIQTMPLVLSTRTYYFTAGSGGGSFQEGYDKGFKDGQEIGFSNGVSQGTQDAYNDGYQYGLEQGNAAGFERGKAAGILIGAANANDYTLLGLLSAVVDAPFTYFTSLTNFDLLGVNIFNFITGLFTLLFFVVLVKLLLGGK